MCIFGLRAVDCLSDRQKPETVALTYIAHASRLTGKALFRALAPLHCVPCPYHGSKPCFNFSSRLFFAVFIT